MYNFQCMARVRIRASSEIKMEPHNLLPPRLEDAGLEDCALPPDSIREAFLKAAAAVGVLNTDEEEENSSLSEPWATGAGNSDYLPGITWETKPPGPCSNEKGDAIPEVMGDEDGAGIPDAIKAEDKSDKAARSKLREEGKECVDALEGLKIGEKEIESATLISGATLIRKP